MENLNIFIRYYLNKFLFVFLVTLKVMIYGKQMEPDNFSFYSLFFPVFFSILTLASVSLFFSNKRGSKFLYFCNLIITLLIISDLTYFRYFKDVISIPVLINGLQLGAVKSSVSSLVKLSDFFYALDLIILPQINRYVCKNNNVQLSRRLEFSIAITLLLMCVGLDARSFYNLSLDQPRLLSTMYNKVYVVRKLGTVNYHYLDIYNSLYSNISKKTPLSKAKENEIKTFLQTNTTDTNNLRGIAKGKNLIMIQVEALQGFAMNNMVNGQEITPNLNRWAERSEYFNNFYYQIAAGGTSDAEFISNNSLYPAAAGAAYFLYCGNEFNAMPKKFKEAGYDTAAFHGYKETFWNRNIVYRRFGFNNFYAEKSYTINENVGLGLSDKSFLSQSVSKIKNLTKPYYAFMVTLSSHFPYDDVKNYGNFDVGAFNNTLLGNYLKAIHYTDEQLGMFLAELEKEGILKDSVVVLYGDHYAIPRNQEMDLAKFLGKSSLSDLDWMKLQKVPLIIHFPEEDYISMNWTLGGQMDIYPTICNLFDLPNKNLMGKDLFNFKDNKIIFRDGSFVDDNYYYMAQTNTYYDINSSKKINENDNLKDRKENALNQLQYSDEILKHNLLKKFKLEDK